MKKLISLLVLSLVLVAGVFAQSATKMTSVGYLNKSSEIITYTNEGSKTGVSFMSFVGFSGKNVILYFITFRDNKIEAVYTEAGIAEDVQVSTSGDTMTYYVNGHKYTQGYTDDYHWIDASSVLKNVVFLYVEKK